MSDDDPIDLSDAAVTARLRAHLAEHEAALARGDPRASTYSERYLMQMLRESLVKGVEAEKALAKAKAAEAALELDRRARQAAAERLRSGGRLQ